MKSPPSPPSGANKKRNDWLQHFRAHLHLAITAKQTGQTKKLDDLPGPRTQDYCRELAKLPDNTLALELATPVTAILDQISSVSSLCEAILRFKDEKAVAMHATAQRILDQLDLALGFILRSFDVHVLFRSEVTEDHDLLVETTRIATTSGERAARLVRRYQQLLPMDCLDKDGSLSEGGFVESFAWDVYLRVAELDRLVDEFPDHIRFAARQMHAWPMLAHRHTNNRRRFKQLADRLELGADYPIDASNGARFRPDTPLVRYLDPVIYRLHSFYYQNSDREFESTEKENESIAQLWRQWPEELPGGDILAVLRETRRLPPLTKATAAQWAEKAIVPLILVTDARDYPDFTVPVLKQIAKQKGVKSRATFKSRLLSAVTATLRRLARPA
jgi:hypothetical protein